MSKYPLSPKAKVMNHKKPLTTPKEPKVSHSHDTQMNLNQPLMSQELGTTKNSRKH